MPHATNERRSARKRKRNQRYTNDAFEVIGLVDADGDSPTRYVSDDGSDDFTLNQAEEEGLDVDDEIEEEDLAVSGEDDVQSHHDEDEEDAGSEIIEVESDDSGMQGNNSRPKGKPGPKPRPDHPDETHSRGTKGTTKNHSRHTNLLRSYGDDEDAKIKLLKVQDKWFDEITLPSRRVRKGGKGGLCHSHWVTNIQREAETNKGWDWLYDRGGRTAFDTHQKSKAMRLQNAQQYLPPNRQLQDFVMGPPEEQSLFSLPFGGSLDVNDAWSDNVPDLDTQSQQKKQKSRKSWILNAGGYVNNVAWCPNQTGRSQFLAIITTEHPDVKGEALRTDPTHSAPELSPAEPSPASIQIWAFLSTSGDDEKSPALVDMSFSPRLHTVICMDWGGVKEIKWCPCLREFRDNEDEDEMDDDKLELGLLAVRCGDGAVRVLNINLDPRFYATPTCIHISQAAWTSRPSTTIATCMTWISSTHIAAGTADGHVAVWDISSALCKSSSLQDLPQATPSLYIPIDITYILQLESFRPSRPHLLAATSMSGYFHMFDLRFPFAARTNSTRNRIGTKVLSWSEQTQHAITAEDSQAIRAHNIRGFHNSSLLTHEESGVACLATSEYHPMMILGQTDGSAMVTNPTRRLLHRKTAGDHYRQKWFVQQWRRGRTTEVASNGDKPAIDQHDAMQVDQLPDAIHSMDRPTLDENDYNATASAIAASNTNGTISTNDPAVLATTASTLDYPNGLCRISTGHQVELISSDPTGKSNRKPSARSYAPFHRSNEGGVVFQTIHELKSAISAVDWNPNLHVAGWAAAGCGSGLVVVEDLCWD
jgi:transcription factor C subunit 6